MQIDVSKLSPADRRNLIVANPDTLERITRDIDWAAVTGVLILEDVVQRVRDLYKQEEKDKSEGRERPWYQGWVDYFTKTGSPYPCVPPEDAARIFSFDPGEPRDGAFYVLDPYRSDYYLVPANANEKIAQQKVAVFIRLVGQLGAKEVKLLSAELGSKESSGNLGVSLPEISAKLGLKASFTSSGEIRNSVLLSFDRFNGEIALSPDIEEYLVSEPVLDSMVQTRLNSNLKETSIALRFKNQSGVDAKLFADLHGCGFKMGGRYAEMTESTWILSISFWPKEI